MNLNKYKNKESKIFKLLIKKILPHFSENKYQTIQVGKLTDEEMFRFNLGPYLKKSTPGSGSV